MAKKKIATILIVIIVFAFGVSIGSTINTTEKINIENEIDNENEIDSITIENDDNLLITDWAFEPTDIEMFNYSITIDGDIKIHSLKQEPDNYETFNLWIANTYWVNGEKLKVIQIDENFFSSINYYNSIIIESGISILFTDDNYFSSIKTKRLYLENIENIYVTRFMRPFYGVKIKRGDDYYIDYSVKVECNYEFPYVLFWTLDVDKFYFTGSKEEFLGLMDTALTNDCTNKYYQSCSELLFEVDRVYYNQTLKSIHSDGGENLK